MGTAGWGYVVLLLVAVGFFAHSQQQRALLALTERDHIQEHLQRSRATVSTQADEIRRLQRAEQQRAAINQQREHQIRQLAAEVREAREAIREADAPWLDEPLPDSILRRVCKFAGRRPNGNGAAGAPNGVVRGAGCAAIEGK